MSFGKSFKKLSSNVKKAVNAGIKANTKVIKAGIGIVAGRLTGGAAASGGESSPTDVAQPALDALRETASNTVSNYLTKSFSRQPAAAPGLPGGGDGPASLNRKSGNVRQIGNNAPPLGVGLFGVDNRILWGAVAALLALFLIVRRK